MMRPFVKWTSLFLLFLHVGLSTGCTSLFFYPQKQLLDNPAVRQFSPDDVYFSSPDGLLLHGWLFTAQDAVGSILVLHGNAENISTHVNSVLWLVQEGFNIFIIDYRGYGLSGGKPDIKGIHLDAEAALETLLAMPQVDKDRIVILGQSLGGAVAVHTVANSPDKGRIKALIIESAFSGYRTIAREKLGNVCLTRPFQYPLSFFFNDDYSPVKWIKNVAPVPVLILHGERDPIVPAHHGEALFEAAREPKDFWRTAPPGHIRSFADGTVRKNLLQYLSRLLPGRHAAVPCP